MPKICLDSWQVRALERDGLGWGHDIECGCLQIEGAVPAKASLATRMRRALTRGRRS